MGEKYHLTWNDFQSSQSCSIGQLLKSEEFTDVTLACEEDKQIEAHKVILSTCSPFFRNILLKNPHPHPLIYVPKVSLHEMQSLLQFMYLGQTEVSHEDLKTFMKVGSMLKIKGLVENETFTEQTSGYKQSAQDEPIKALIENEVATDHTDGFCDSEQDETMNLVDGEDRTVMIKEEDYAADNQHLGDDIQEVWYQRNEQYNYSSDTANSELQKKFPCEKCEYRSRTKGDLKKHVLAIHEGVRYPCDQCNYRATQSGHLKLHKKTQHSKSLGVKC
eukprot:GFUD01104424.1.p1 GENE.GFUD01104424.1~~GFUD01104424.1.p1  ORF type:complete len:275 (-),score=30.23 GFUD01104424.1:32-856(-)